MNALKLTLEFSSMEELLEFTTQYSNVKPGVKLKEVVNAPATAANSKRTKGKTTKQSPVAEVTRMPVSLNEVKDVYDTLAAQAEHVAKEILNRYAPLLSQLKSEDYASILDDLTEGLNRVTETKQKVTNIETAKDPITEEFNKGITPHEVAAQTVEQDLEATTATCTLQELTDLFNQADQQLGDSLGVPLIEAALEGYSIGTLQELQPNEYVNVFNKICDLYEVGSVHDLKDLAMNVHTHLINGCNYSVEDASGLLAMITRKYDVPKLTASHYSQFKDIMEDLTALGNGNSPLIQQYFDPDNAPVAEVVNQGNGGATDLGVDDVTIDMLKEACKAYTKRYSASETQNLIVAYGGVPSVRSLHKIEVPEARFELFKALQG